VPIPARSAIFGCASRIFRVSPFNTQILNGLSQSALACSPFGRLIALISSEEEIVMRSAALIVLSTVLLLILCFPQNASAAPGSIRGEVIIKAENGERSVLPDAHIVLHGPINKEAQWDAHGAFAIESLPPGIYDIEASAPGLNAALAVEVEPGTASVIPIELAVAAITSSVTVTASPDVHAYPERVMKNSRYLVLCSLPSPGIV